MKMAVKAIFKALSFTALTLAGSLLSARSDGYVDSKVCAACHRQATASFVRTGMGRSLFRPAQKNTIENYATPEFYHALSDTHYAMVQKNGGYYQRRWQVGIGGKETNAEELNIDYVIGSGNHARSYFHRTERGTLIQLPLGWYSEKGGHWGMSPGFDSAHPQTRRLVSYECMFCHNAYPAMPGGHEAANSEPVFTGSLPSGIDCQRCHGPGGKHVAAVQIPGATAEAIRASIVNPARLNPEQQMEVCMQCHLEPTSTALPSIIRRFNRGPFSYVAGQRLSDFALYFDHAPATGHDDKFEIASSAYRFRKSQCYLQSRGALTCETCHNPHQILQGEEAKQHYLSVCMQCHSDRMKALISSDKHTSKTDCVSCHMPKRRTEDVVHVVMTDHLIQRRIPARDLLAELPERHPTEAEDYHGEVVAYYPSSLTDEGEGRLYHAVAQVELKNNLESGLRELDSEVKREQPREAEFYAVLGSAWASSGRPDRAAIAFERAFGARPDLLGTFLSAFAGSLKASGQPARLVEIISQAERMDPSNSLPWFDSGALDAEQGRTAEAIEKFRKAIALSPDLNGARMSLGRILAETGQPGEAEVLFRQALSIDPYDATAHDLLGRALVAKGSMTEAVYEFERAVRLRPRYEPNLYDYALMLMQLNRPEESERIAREAIEADPKQADAHELLGIMLARKGRLAEAAGEYQVVVQLRPDLYRAQLELATILVAQGDLAGAIPHLQEAAKSPDTQIAQRANRALLSVGSR